MVNVPLVKVPGIPVNLDGEIFILPPLALNPLNQLKKRIAAFSGDLDDESTATVIDAVHSALRRNYPEITKEWVGEVVDVANMNELMEACMDASGLKRRALEAGE